MAQLYAQYPAKHTWRNGKNKGKIVTITGYRPELYPQGVGQYYIGEIEGYTYIPALNDNQGGYREGGYGSPEGEPKKPSMWDQVKPIATVGGAYAATQALIDSEKRGRFLGGITSLPNDIYESIFGGSGKQGAVKDIYNFGSKALDPNFNDLYDLGKTGLTKAENFLSGLLEGGSAQPAMAAPSLIATTKVPATAGLLEGGVASMQGGATKLIDGTIVDAAGNVVGKESMVGALPEGASILGDVIIPAAGAYGLYDLIDSGDAKGTSGAVQGGLSGAALGSYFGPPGTVVGGILGGLLGGSGILGHESTKEAQAKRIANLSPAGQAYFADATRIAEQNDNRWTEGKYAGEKWSWDKALDLAKEDPTHFIGNIGNFETYGDKWFGTPIDKQKQIVSRLINENLYDPEKGSIIITDQSRAQQIYDEEMGIKPPAPEPEEEKYSSSMPQVSGGGMPLVHGGVWR